MSILSLHQQLSAIAPIVSVDSNRRIIFQESATEAEKAAAQDYADAWIDPPEPDWAGFRLALYAEDAWKRVLNSNPAVGATIASILWQFQTDPTLAAEVSFLWDSLIPGLDPALSVDEITALNLIAIDNNVPMVVEDDGFLSFSD